MTFIPVYSRHGDGDLPPAVPHNDPLATADDGNDDLYDNFGNYVGDQSEYFFFLIKKNSQR